MEDLSQRSTDKQPKAIKKESAFTCVSQRTWKGLYFIASKASSQKRFPFLPVPPPLQTEVVLGEGLIRGVGGEDTLKLVSCALVTNFCKLPVHAFGPSSCCSICNFPFDFYKALHRSSGSRLNRGLPSNRWVTKPHVLGLHPPLMEARILVALEESLKPINFPLLTFPCLSSLF